MEERVDRLLPYGYVDLWISTFHSFCERILRNHGLDIGLPANFKILSETEAWLLIRQNLDKFNLPKKFFGVIVGAVGFESITTKKGITTLYKSMS